MLKPPKQDSKERMLFLSQQKDLKFLPDELEHFKKKKWKTGSARSKYVVELLFKKT